MDVSVDRRQKLDLEQMQRRNGQRAAWTLGQVQTRGMALEISAASKVVSQKFKQNSGVPIGEPASLTPSLHTTISCGIISMHFRDLASTQASKV